MQNHNPIKRIFDLYTSDLTFDEIEKLIKRESSEVYKFFATEMPKPDTTKNKFIRALIFIRSLFNAFILKLSAARRVFYIAALIIFFIGFFQEIGSYVVFSFILMNLLLAFELADKLSTKGELDLARKIQKNLIPVPPYKIFGFDVSAHYETAREVGGDYFDIVKHDKNNDESIIIVGDISGKGIAAALYMVRVQAIINLLISNSAKLKEIIINLKKFFSQNLEKEYFLTLCALKVNSNGKINFVRAGHQPMLHYKAKEKELIEINPKGIGIGFNDKGAFEKLLEEVTIKPDSGDLFILYTDGINEAMNEGQNQFGMERFKKLIENNADKSPERIKEIIVDAIHNFQGNAITHDDLTLIVLKSQ